MSYTVLARKWRPQKFEDVVGQRHVTQSLVNALSMGRVAHAFLFSGTRGVGKTTTARILAKALNCVQGPTPEPCGVCDSCTEITRGVSVDVMEIDGASNTGVDNVRELRENVKYAPSRGRHKVYIIDEVHMLSTSAFNALLKTLEEPPEHVVFIFATTDPHKVPATILSRCQHYDFRRVPKTQLQAHLKGLCSLEGLRVEDAALARLATLAEGSVRDSLSLLDQVVSFRGEEGVSEADIDDILGLVGREAVKGAAKAVTTQDPAEAVEVVAGLVDKGHDLRRFSTALLEFFRDILVTKVVKAPEKTLELPTSEIDEIKAIAKGITAEEVMRVMNILSRLSEEMKWSAHPKISVELALIKAASRPISSIEDVLASVSRLKDGGCASTAVRETRAPGTGFGQAAHATEGPQPSAPRRSVREPLPTADDSAYYDSPAPSVAAGDSEATELWDQARAGIKAMGKAPLAAKMMTAAPEKVDGSQLVVVNQGVLEIKDDEVALINQALEAIKGPGFTLKVTRGAGSGVKKKTLAEVKQEREVTRKDKMKSEAVEHPFVKSALDLFGGEVVDVVDEKAGT
ncbi:MAG: DNA polymerase III subunit gamma/tau [Nitrospirae bacterium]|nr:DNA polymerase III subunit gamma/tau [Nitrospirota bacterium]